MNEQKLKLILKQLTTLANLQEKKNKNIDKKIKLLREMCVVLNEQNKVLANGILRLESENLTKSERIT